MGVSASHRQRHTDPSGPIPKRDARRRSVRYSARTIARCTMLLLLLAAIPSCDVFRSKGSGSLRAESIGVETASIESAFPTAFYSNQLSGELSFYVADAPQEQVIERTMRSGQILHVELLWEPKPGRTPMDPSATNVSLRYIIISDGEVGVYAGAGFAVLDGDIGDSWLYVSLRNTTLRLESSTERFTDLLGATRLTGSFVARYDPAVTRQLHYAASQLVTDALNKTRIVAADDDLAGS